MSDLNPLKPGETEESVIDTEDDNPTLTLGDLQNNTTLRMRTQLQAGKSLARDSCGEGNSRFYQTSSGAIWKKFPIFVFIDESNYPGNETKTQVRSAIISVFRDVNEILGFPFFSVRLDPLVCPIKVSFQELDTGGIGHTSWRYNRDKEMTQATIRLHTGTRWFINPNEQCYSSGRYLHMNATLAHELGHAIGIAHNSTDNKATMRPFSQAGETLRASFGLSEKTFMHQFYDQFKPVR